MQQHHYLPEEPPTYGPPGKLETGQLSAVWSLVSCGVTQQQGSSKFETFAAEKI